MIGYGHVPPGAKSSGCWPFNPLQTSRSLCTVRGKRSECAVSHCGLAGYLGNTRRVIGKKFSEFGHRDFTEGRQIFSEFRPANRTILGIPHLGTPVVSGILEFSRAQQGEHAEQLGANRIPDFARAFFLLGSPAQMWGKDSRNFARVNGWCVSRNRM